MTETAARQVEITWDANRFDARQLLGYARIRDGVGQVPARLESWDDEIARQVVARLGGNALRRVATPQSLLRFPAGPTLPGTELVTLSSPPDENTVIGVAYLCPRSR